MALLCCLSCKTTKQTTKSNEQSKLNAALNLQSESNIKTATAFDWSKVDVAKVKEHIRITEYSEPDSSGNQYVIREADIKRETDNESSEAATGNETTAGNEKTSDKSLIDADSKSDHQAKITKETTTPIGVSIGLVVLAFGIIVIIILVLKRFGLIKW